MKSGGNPLRLNSFCWISPPASSLSFPFRKVQSICILLSLVAYLLTLSTSHAEENKQVVFIRYSHNPAQISAMMNSFKQRMIEHGYLEGINIDYIDILTNSPGRESVLEILEATDRYRDDADIFITTSWVSLYTRSKLTRSDTPQIFAPVLKSVALNMLPQIDREPETNVSGVYLNYPPEKILRLTRLILPGIRNYAYVYDSNIPADLIFKSEYSKLSTSERHGIIIHFIDLSQGINNTLTELKKKKIEAFGGVIGAFTHRKELDRSGLPIVTSLLRDVDQESLIDFIRESNMIAGLFNSFEYCGEQAADMTAAIFDSENTISRTVPRPARQSAFVNLKAARRLDVAIPFAALEAVDFVIK